MMVQSDSDGGEWLTWLWWWYRLTLISVFDLPTVCWWLIKQIQSHSGAETVSCPQSFWRQNLGILPTLCWSLQIFYIAHKYFYCTSGNETEIFTIRHNLNIKYVTQSPADKTSVNRLQTLWVQIKSWYNKPRSRSSSRNSGATQVKTSQKNDIFSLPTSLSFTVLSSTALVKDPQPSWLI